MVAAIRTKGSSQTVKQVVPAIYTQAGDAHPGRAQRPDLDPCGNTFKEGTRSTIKSGHLTPGVLVSVLAAPVVILAARPAINDHLLAVDHQLAAVAHLRPADHGFGLWQFGGVEVLRQKQQGYRFALVAKVPTDLVAIVAGAAGTQVAV